MATPKRSVILSELSRLRAENFRLTRSWITGAAEMAKDKFAIGATEFRFTEDEKFHAHVTSVTMGCDAMRICMNLDPLHFPHDEVVQWMNNLRRDTIGQRAAAIRRGDVVSGETHVNQGTFGSEKP